MFFLQAYITIRDQSWTNFVWTLIFILVPSFLISCWNVYIHVTDEDEDKILFFKNLPSPRITNLHKFLIPSIYVLIFFSPLAPCMTFFENTYVQMFHLEQRQLLQLRVAITNVIEATMESTFQFVLQLFIVCTKYNYNDINKVN